MPYLKAVDDVVSVVPYHIHELKKENPNTSFPSPLTDDVLAQWNVFPYTEIPAAAFDPMVSKAEKLPPQKINGAWVVDNEIRQLPQSVAEANIRNKRNMLLSDCDWTQLADASVDSLAWANYRQALRDIPQQAGFPYSITWPPKP